METAWTPPGPDPEPLTINLRVTGDDAPALRQLAEKHNRTVPELVRSMIAHCIRQQGRTEHQPE
jgi:hypothetical protein